MADAPVNARGDVIITDDQPNPTPHPTPGDLKADDAQPAIVGDAKADDAPVRTDRPDVNIVQRLGHGMGEHVPPDPAKFDEDGRLIVPIDEPLETATVDEKENRERQKAADKTAKADAAPK